MKNMNSLLSLSLSLAALSGYAGDLLVDGDLNVASNLTSRSLSVTNATVLNGSLTVSGKRVLIGANASTSNDNTFVWSDGTVISGTASNQFSAFASNGFRLLGGPIQGNGSGLTGLIVSNHVAGSIGSAALASNSVTAAKLAVGSVGTAAITNGAITTDRLATGAVTASKLATGSVGAAALANYSVTATKLSPGSVGTAALATGAVMASKLAVGSVGSSAIATGAVTSVNLAAGSVGTNKAAIAEWNAWGNGRYLGVDGSPDLVLTVPGRVVAGYGLSLASISPDAYGASQQGYNNTDTQTIGEWSVGASQQGANEGLQTIGAYSHGAAQHGYNGGVQTIGDDAYGASQQGANEGTQSIGYNATGASQRGCLWYASSATNNGIGSIQLFNLYPSQNALMTGSAAIGLGACTVTNDQSIVAGDGLSSHGNGTVTAVKFYGDGSGLTNLPNSENTLTQAGGTLTGNLNMNGNRVTGLPAPQNDGDAVSKDYVRLVLSKLPPQGNLSMGAYTNGAPSSFPLEF